MDNPIDSILSTYPSDFFRSLEERTNAAFVKAHHLTCEHYAEPEQVNMLGQARHACCEEGFRAAAHDAGLAAARARGRLGGRKPITGADPRVAAAKRLHQDRSLSINEICKTLGISMPTFYRYLALI